MNPFNGLLGSIVFWFLTLGMPGWGRCAEIAFLYALDADWQAFTKAAKAEAVPVSCGDRRLQRLSFAGNTVTAVKMGSGCSETAVSAACVLGRGTFDLMITVGPAGALREGWAPGTMVIIDHLYAWQMTPNEVVPLRIPALAAVAVPGRTAEWELADSSLWRGAIGASGELFVKTTAQRQELAVHADIVDMNTQGAETAAAAWKVPCLHLRVIPDMANENAREDFLSFTRTWDGRGGLAALKLITSLKPDPTRPGSYDELRKLIPKEADPRGRSENQR